MNISCPEISIIVAVYNGSEYLRRCINSIQNQTIKDLEIILIDDGSTDGSGAICDDLEKSDARIRVIHQKNSGLSHSRNVGIKNARGKYVGFVDADDWISLDMYEILYNDIKSNNGEISSVKYQIISNDNEIEKTKTANIEVLQGIDKLRRYLEVGISNRSNLYSACTKLYKKSLFDNIHFPEGKRFEDMATNYKLIQAAEKFIINDKKLYYYFMKSTGITRNKCKLGDLDLIDATKEIYDMTKNTEIEDLGEIVYARSFYSLLVKSVVYGVDKSLNEKEFTDNLYTQYCLYYRKLMKSSMPVNRKIIMLFLRLSPNLMRRFVRVVHKNN